MISTKSLISDITEVPREWIFEYYLNLTEKLCGQNIKINSIFNSRDKTPSMFIYVDNRGFYKYKDFSTGRGGDAINLVEEINNITRSQATYKIIQDYSSYIHTNDYVVQTYVPQPKFEVNDYEIRHWNNLDKDFWLSFHIGSDLLKKYNVHPLSFYNFVKTEHDGTESVINIKNYFIYGYFKEDGTIYKIYQPKQKDKKFLKIKDYTQGFEQLKYNAENLIITSSLKDLMAFMRLKIDNFESIAPDSENSIISENIINDLKTKYKNIYLLFDNDEAGMNAAIKYKKKYEIPYINLDLDKDLSDSIKTYGIEKTRNALNILLKQL